MRRNNRNYSQSRIREGDVINRNGRRFLVGKEVKGPGIMMRVFSKYRNGFEKIPIDKVEEMVKELIEIFEKDPECRGMDFIMILKFLNFLYINRYTGNTFIPTLTEWSFGVPQFRERYDRVITRFTGYDRVFNSLDTVT